MTDITKPLIITDPHRVPPVFINRIVGRGILNGVVNLTFATLFFTPQDDNTVDPDAVITARVRMDLACAHQLYAALGEIIAKETAAPPKAEQN